VFLAAAAVLIFFFGLAFIPIDRSPATSQFVSEAVRQYQFTPSNDQRAAHAYTLLAVAIFSIVAFVLARRGRRFAPSDESICWKLRAPTSAGFIAVGLALYGFLVPHWVIIDATLLTVGFALFVVVAPSLPVRAIDFVIIGAIGAYLAILIVPGFLVDPIPLMAADPVALSQFEMHLLLLTMPGRAIGAGQNFFDQLPSAYGLLASSLMAVIDRLRHGITVGDQLRIVQVSQLLFSLAAAAAYISYRPRSRMGILVALLIAGPYWSAAGLGIWHPNQTGLRSIGLPLGILGMAIAGRLSETRAAWWLGAVAGVALLSNMETAFAVGAGFAVYFVVRTRRIPVKLALHSAAAIVVTFAAYLIFCWVALGRIPIGRDFIDAMTHIARFTGGGYGQRLFAADTDNVGFYVVPFALIMFGHAIYVVIDGFKRLGERALTQREAMRVAIATILLVWLSYYFNAPNWWQIWTHLFLYGFLIIDAFDSRLFGIGLRRLDWTAFDRLRHLRISAARLALLFFVPLMIVHTNWNLWNYAGDFMYPPWVKAPHSASIVSGILLPDDMANALEAKAKKLSELNASTKGSLVYLTFNVAFMPELTGLFERDPERDLWVGIPGDGAFDGVIGSIYDRHPDIILIDAPTGPLAVSGARRDFQDRVRQAIGRRYRLSTTQDGWEIWRPS
jgi:hypothetical protein